MPRSYSIVEPHPSTTTGHYHTGRGGSGNVASTKKTSGVRDTSLVDPTYHQQKVYSSGRGGAGNMHSSSEHAIFSFDEELERQLRQEKDLAPVYHVGRGGAGNKAYSNGSTRRDSSGGSDRSARTASSVESGADAAYNKARRSIERGWGKITERF